MDRRPLRSRRARWIRTVAALLAARGVAPNAISIGSVAAAAAAAVSLLQVPGKAPVLQAALLALSAGLILLRMLANVLDGLVAVEGGLKSSTGDLFNEVPDRLADVLLLAGAGYAIPSSPLGQFLGWSAAVLALFTAYVRVFGGSVGLPQSFSGPMAKPHRMFVLVAAVLLSILEAMLTGYRGRVLLAALAVIGLGSALTCLRRLAQIRAGLLDR